MREPRPNPYTDLRMVLLGLAIGLLPIAVALVVTSVGRGDLGRALLFLLPVLAIGLVAGSGPGPTTGPWPGGNATAGQAGCGGGGSGPDPAVAGRVLRRRPR